MNDGEMELPSMFITSYSVDGKSNHAGGTFFVVLREKGDMVLLGEFGLVEEGSYITREDDEWHFEAKDEEKIDKPPFKAIYEVDRQELVESLQTDEYFYGEAIREAWENWSEGDAFALRIDGDEREFEADDQRLTNYDRREHYDQLNS